MKLFEKFSKFLGIITVKEVGDQIRVTGIDGTIMAHTIARIWETNVLNRHMFTTITNTSLSMNTFFLPDFVYLLTEIRMNPTTRWSGRRTIDKIMNGIIKHTWFGQTTKAITPIVDPARLKLLKWTPLPHQSSFLDLFGDKVPRYDLRGLLLGAAPGSGKSFLDIMVMTCVIPPSVAEVKIIISPKKAVHLVWEKTINQVFKKIPTYWVVGTGVEMPLSKCEYYVFNFEQLDQAILLAHHLRSEGKRFFVTVDESHNFADYRSTRTQRLVNLQTLDSKTLFLWLSGSPILKHAAELVSFLKCSDPRFNADAERRFRRIYSSNKGRAGEIFHHRFGQMMGILIPKSVVSTTKPTVKELPVRLPPSLAHKFLLSTIREEMKSFVAERIMYYDNQLKSYRVLVQRQLDHHAALLKTKPDKKRFDKYKKNLALIIATPDRILPEIQSEARVYERTKLIPMMEPHARKEFRNALSAVKNIKLKVRGEALGTVLAQRRSECTAVLAIYCKPDEIIKESLSKTLFFASSVKPVKVLEAFLKKKGFDPLAVYADTNSQLVRMMESFESDPNVNPVIATMQSLSEAVPVTAASTVVLLNRPFREAQYSQSTARVDRLGQRFPVTIIEITLDTDGEPNVSSRTDEILSEVREQINALIGPSFAGPDPDEREYKELIDASQEDPVVLEQDEKIGL